jgi:cytochrome d ubiquinol oxidase subunit I
VLTVFETLDPVLLARIQFAFTIAFHIVFPAFTIGLASYLAVLEVLWLASGDRVYQQVYDYWLKIFAVAFGMGVVSGVVMSYQFGTNWSVFSDKTGPVLGPMMGYEVLSAFFLEATFLGVMLFGRERAGKALHAFATLMVAAGTLFSAFWILAVNSWMHTPRGYTTNEAGQFVPQDWWAIVFNPSFPYRLVHMVLAAYLATAFIVGATGAYHLLRAQGGGAARKMLSMAMWMAAFVTPVQIVAGDLHGLNTFEYQPAKVAAMEGHFQTYEKGAPLILFGLPDMDARSVRHAVEVPKLGSLILTHSLEGKVQGLDTWPREDWPNVTIVFFTFRLMVGIAFIMLFVGIASLVLRLRRRLFEAKWFLRTAMLMGPSGFVAMLAGWFTTEIGRQPYTVYGLLKTVHSASPIAAPGVAGSLVAFVAVYGLVFGTGIFYLLNMMARPPEEPDVAPVQSALPGE